MNKTVLFCSYLGPYSFSFSEVSLGQCALLILSYVGHSWRICSANMYTEHVEYRGYVYVLVDQSRHIELVASINGGHQGNNCVLCRDAATTADQDLPSVVLLTGHPAWPSVYGSNWDSQSGPIKNCWDEVINIRSQADKHKNNKKYFLRANNNKRSVEF
jgi:hypothetical protein